MKWENVMKAEHGVWHIVSADGNYYYYQKAL